MLKPTIERSSSAASVPSLLRPRLERSSSVASVSSSRRSCSHGPARLISVVALLISVVALLISVVANAVFGWVVLTLVAVEPPPTPPPSPPPLAPLNTTMIPAAAILERGGGIGFDQCSAGSYSWPGIPIGLPGGNYLEMCVPTKCSFSTTDKLLRFAAGDLWNNQARSTILGTSCRKPAPGEAGNATKRAYLIVRNPYERLLSAFLGQVAAPSSGGSHRDQDARAHLHLPFGPNGSSHARYGAFQPTPESFADFVLQLTAKPPGLGGKLHGGGQLQGFASDHLEPITSSPRHCLRPEYRWGRPWQDYYTVLKLEQQTDWYADWVRDNRLARWTQSRRWPGGCFWRAPNKSCAETLSVRSVTVNASASLPKRRCQAASGHNTGTCLTLRKFYTDALAALVTAYAAEDLKAFSYPAWLPSWGPAPEAGPPVSERGTYGQTRAASWSCSCRGSKYS